MRIEVTGRQIDVGDALRSHVEEKLVDALSKYSNRPVSASLTLSRDAHLFACDCSAHLSTGLTAQATAKETDVYGACDAAIHKLEKQLRRYKRRLKDHHLHRKEPVAQVEAAAYVLRAGDDDSPEAGDDAAAMGETPEFWTPVVIAETTEAVPALSVGEAVMQLELGRAPLLLFMNESRGRLNAVYRRDDGHIGWIDPAPASGA